MRTSTAPNELVTSTGPPASVIVTSPLLLLTRQRLPTFEMATRPKRSRTSRAPSTHVTTTAPLLLVMVTGPLLPETSTVPKEFSRRWLPFPSLNTIVPLEL